MRTKFLSWVRANRLTSDGTAAGQGLVEYALILVMVAVVCIASVLILGVEVQDLWAEIEDLIVSTLAS